MILLPIFVSVTNKTKFMPEICRFFGIIIFLYWKDHNPPHIHFTYADYECSISVLDRIVDGQAQLKLSQRLMNGLICMKQKYFLSGRRPKKGKK